MLVKVLEMKKVCIIAFIAFSFIGWASQDAEARGDYVSYNSRGNYVIYYPAQRGYVAVRYGNKNQGYHTYYIRTYTDRESRNMSDVLRKGAIDMATLGIAEALH